MMRTFKKVLFLGISMCYATSCLAQFIDDIPLFDEVPETKQASASTPKETVPVPSQPQTKPNEPNIGRKGIPLDKVVLTPEPLPEIAIPLNDQPPAPIAFSEPKQPQNTRQESIYLPPADKTGTAPAQPSQFADLHDVRQFDLEGFYLGMTPQAVLQMARQKGYALTQSKKALPLFQTTYYDTLCRQSGIYVPEQVRACIRQKAHEKKQDYIEMLVFNKKATRESFHFYFTSPATGNELFRIIYQTKGDNSLAFTRPNVVKKLGRKEAFFNAVFNLYGYPDDNKALLWGAKEDAYMQVGMSGSSYNAMIILNDTKLSDEDYFAASDWKAEQGTTHHFGFAE